MGGRYDLESVRDLLLPGVRYHAPDADLTVDRKGDRLLLNGHPLFTREEIDNNSYKREFKRRVREITYKWP